MPPAKKRIEAEAQGSVVDQSTGDGDRVKQTSGGAIDEKRSCGCGTQSEVAGDGQFTRASSVARVDRAISHEEILPVALMVPSPERAPACVKVEAEMPLTLKVASWATARLPAPIVPVPLRTSVPALMVVPPV